VTDPVTAGDALAAGWEWLATLPRAATAHAARGDDPLAAMRGLLAELDHPQRRLRAIHLAGSKGKGSTALYVEAVLERLGQRTFTYTSPHLERWTERFRLDGAEAPADAALEALRAVRAAARTSGIRPGFFEALTVAGFVLAARANADWAIIEAGVGGRADATNVVHPHIAVLTSVELEHTERLGHTLEAIAREKLGIVKAGIPLVAPELDRGVEAEIDAALRATGSDRVRVRRMARPTRIGLTGAVHWHRDGAGPVTVSGAGWSVRTPLATPGHVAGANAALSLATVAQLGIAPAAGLQRAARVLADRPLPGRAEIVSILPWVLVDGAHTAASAHALRDVLDATGARRIHLLLSVSASKPVADVLAPLLERADAATVTRADPDYSLAADDLAAAIRALAPGLAVETVPDPDVALAHTARDAPGETLVVATGSVYLAGRVRRAFSH